MSRKRTVCKKCSKPVWCDPHHPYRKRNNREVTIYLCRKCHEWVRHHINEARKLGLYKNFDSIYRKRMKKFKTPDFSKKKKRFKMPRTKDRSLKQLEGMKSNKKLKRKKKRSKFKPF